MKRSDRPLPEIRPEYMNLPQIDLPKPWPQTNHRSRKSDDEDEDDQFSVYKD